MTKSVLRAWGLGRLSALACVVAYLLGGTELLPMLLALGAGLEGSHTVHLAREPGRLAVVLGHERGDPVRRDFSPRHQNGNALHRHGVAARVVCLLASRSPRMTDHVAAFAAAQVAEVAPRQALDTPSSSLFAPVAALLSLQAFKTSPTAEQGGDLPALSFQSPVSLSLLRSVSLLV